MKPRELPLTALRAFSIAARSTNLTTAADELGVTHGAVSKQIASLESWLGQSLFARDGRSLRLTPFGHILAERVSETLDGLGSACEYVRRGRSRKVVTVEAPTTFAMYFLLSQTQRYEQANPGISVWVSTRASNEPPNFARHDIVITRGKPTRNAPRGVTSQVLMEENLTVVTAGSILRGDRMTSPEDLHRYPLIASTSRPGDWDNWFSTVGMAARTVQGGHHFDHLFVALHAVRDGLGSTIAPRTFFNEADNKYDLHCPFPDVTIAGETIYAHVGSSDGHVAAFLHWLTVQCSAGR